MDLTDVHLLYSGGADAETSLGGAASDTEITSNVLGNLFGDVTLDESEAGLVDYRCFYVKNVHAEDSLFLAALFIRSNTPSTDTAVAIGLDPAGMNAEAQTIADREQDPVGVTFADYPSSGSGLALGTLGPGDFVAVWVRRTVAPNASTPSLDPFTLRITGVPVEPTSSP